MTQIKQLEDCLEEDIMFEKIKNHFIKTGHDIPEKQVDVSRRNFLKSSAVLGVGLAVGGLGFSGNAHAGNKSTILLNRIDKFGPGSNTRDKVLTRFYKMAHYNRETGFAFDYLLNPKKNYTFVEGTRAQVINPNTPYIEPFYHFVANSLKSYHGVGDQCDFKELTKRNPALDYFDYSINGFRLNWIEPKISGKLEKQVEENGLKSICVAAFGKQKGEQAAKGMLNSDINGKKLYARKIIESFSSMKGYDKNSTDPQNPFNQALVANWAAYILNNHFQNLLLTNNPRGFAYYSPKSKYFREVEFYSDELVKPLEKFAYRVQPVDEEYYHLMRTFYLEKDRKGELHLISSGGPR